MKNNSFATGNLLFKLIATVLILSPLFRGLYYELPMYVAAVAVAIIFLVTVFKSGPEHFRFLKHPLDLPMVLLLAAYLLSTCFAAADHREAAAVAIRIALLVMFYFLAGLANRHSHDKALWVVYAATLLSSIVTLISVLGIRPNDLIFEKSTSLVATTLEYKNAGALFILLGILSGLYLWNQTNNIKTRTLLAAGNYLLFLLLVGTQSRTVWILTAFLLILYLAITRGQRSSLILFLNTSVPALVAQKYFYQSVSVDDMAGSMSTIIFGALASIGIAHLGRRFGARLTAGRSRLVYIAAVGVLVVLVAGVFLQSNSLIVQRVSTISTDSFSLQERLAFYRDALKLFKAHPLLGAGGRGWDVLYLNVQSYGYYAENVHNDYLQVAVETGIVGLLAYLALWATALFSIYKSLHSRQQPRDLTIVLLILVLAFGLHSLFDFDLAHTALSLVLFFILGLVRAITLGTTAKVVNLPSKQVLLANKVVTATVCLSVIGGSFSFGLGAYYYQKGTEALENNWLDETRAMFLQAKSFDPYNVNTLVSLAQVDLGLANANPSLVTEAVECTTKAITLRPAEPLFYQVYADALFKQGQFDLGIEQLKKYINRHPMLQKAYEDLAAYYISVGQQYYNNGNVQQSKKYFQLAFAVPALVEKQLSSVSENDKNLWATNRSEPVLNISGSLNLSMAKAAGYLGQWPRAAELLSKIPENEKTADTMLWLGIVQQRRGFSNEAQEIIQMLNQSDPELAAQYDQLLKTLPK